MTDITVKEFSKTVGLPVTRLIDQLQLAGVNKKDADELKAKLEAAGAKVELK